MSESIRVEQLSKLYQSRDGTEVEALHDVSFTVGRQSLGQVRAGRTISAILNCALTELGFFRRASGQRAPGRDMLDHKVNLDAQPSCKVWNSSKP